MSGKNYMKHHILPIFLLGCAATLGTSGVAYAKPQPAECSPIPSSGASPEFDTSNVTFRGGVDNPDAWADACAGLDGNDSQWGGNYGVQVLGDLESPFGGAGDWYFLAKDDVPGSAGSDTGTVVTDSGDVEFTLTETSLDGGAASSGTWELSWSGDGLPLTMDFAVVLKAGTSWGAFLFEDEAFEAPPASGSGTGTWAIQFYNKGGQIPAISHFSLYFRNATGCEPGPCGGGPGGGVPVPAPLALLGLGAGLLGWTSRRSRA